MIKEPVAGASFLDEDVSLAEARVHEETEAKGHVTFADKIIDDLRAAFFVQGEIVFGEIGDDLAVFISDGGKDTDCLYLDSNLRGSTLRCLGTSLGLLRWFGRRLRRGLRSVRRLPGNAGSGEQG
jgi:hypothetical protein